MSRAANYLKSFVPKLGLFAAEAEQKNPGLFTQYMIRLESIWLGLRKSEAEIKADPILEKIQTLMRDCAAPVPDWATNWRNAALAEQLMAAYLDAPDLAVQGERRLFEANKMKMAAAAHFSSKWETALAEPDALVRLKTQRGLYVDLLDELQWQHRKNRFNRMIRTEISGTVRTLAMILFFFAVLPFLPWFGGQTVGGLFFPAETDSGRLHLYGIYTACSFGLLGALFSRLSAFQSTSSVLDYDDLMNLFQKNALYIRLLLGMIGSLIVFYGIFGKFLDGDLFPDVDLLSFKPAEKPDGNFAKLVIWCFLGGFSERLVPEFLTRTETSAAKTG